MRDCPSAMYVCREGKAQKRQIQLGSCSRLEPRSAWNQNSKPETELVSKHNLGTDDAEKFLQFATTPKANLPIETLIKVWKEGEGKGAKTSENMEAVKKTKSIPKPAGVLQGGEQPRPSEEDEVWKRVMNAGTRGRLTKQS